MITESTIYWITRMSYLQTLSFIIGGTGLILGIISVIGTCTSLDDCDDPMKISELKKLRKRFLRGCIFSILLLIGACFIPTTKEMCAIKVIPIIVNNEQAQQLPTKVLDLADEWLEELRPNNQSNK